MVEVRTRVAARASVQTEVRRGMNPYRGVVAACWAVFLVYWIVSAFSVKETAEGHGWRRWGWRIPIIVAVALLLLLDRIPVVARFAGERLWPTTPPEGILADALVVCGLAIAIWARWTLGGNWSSDPVIKERHELIERGPYAHVRHPIYSGMLLMLLGAAVLLARPVALIAFAIFVFGFWFKARQEEQLLTRYFPDEYPRYRARVKALIPFVL